MTKSESVGRVGQTKIVTDASLTFSRQSGTVGLMDGGQHRGLDLVRGPAASDDPCMSTFTCCGTQCGGGQVGSRGVVALSPQCWELEAGEAPRLIRWRLFIDRDGGFSGT